MNPQRWATATYRQLRQPTLALRVLQVAGLKLNQISAAVAALTAGFWVDKQESTNTNYVVSAEPEPTREERAAEFCRPAIE